MNGSRESEVEGLSSRRHFRRADLNGWAVRRIGRTVQKMRLRRLDRGFAGRVRAVDLEENDRDETEIGGMGVMRNWNSGVALILGGRVW